MNSPNIFKKQFLFLSFGTLFMLLIPFTAMQFSGEVNWSPGDFLIAGLMLFGTGLLYILATIKADTTVYRVATGLALVTALFLTWSNLAVGIIGSENNSINSLYFGVILVGIIGAIFSRFQPKRMAFTLVAMALTQCLITIIALSTGTQHSTGNSLFKIVAVNGFFISLFIASALLFGYAASRKLSRV